MSVSAKQLGKNLLAKCSRNIVVICYGVGIVIFLCRKELQHSLNCRNVNAIAWLFASNKLLRRTTSLRWRGKMLAAKLAMSGAQLARIYTVRIIDSVVTCENNAQTASAVQSLFASETTTLAWSVIELACMEQMPVTCNSASWWYER